MANVKPVVIPSSGLPQQLQSTDDLDIPINDRVDAIEQQLTALTTFLAAQGFEIPDELRELL